MCGRITQKYTWAELWEWYNLTNASAPNLRATYNIAPTQNIDVIRSGETGLILEKMRWWLVPGWWKKSLKDVPATFNARAETVATKPMFRNAFKSRRCVIPVSGFFEWTGPKIDRQPHYISATNRGPLSLAGLWESWQNEDGEDLQSTTIIVCAANRFMSNLHHRMPVILGRDDVSRWIDAGAENLLQPCPDDWLKEWPVTKHVNSTRFEGSEAIENENAKGNSTTKS